MSKDSGAQRGPQLVSGHTQLGAAGSLVLTVPGTASESRGRADAQEESTLFPHSGRLSLSFQN